MTEDPNKPSSSVINEPKTDSFTEFKKDPRLDKSVNKTPNLKYNKEHSNFTKKILKITEYEDFLNELRQYKRKQHNLINQKYEPDPINNRETILKELSTVAEDIIIASQSWIQREFEAKFGLPTFLSSYKQDQAAYLALICMGKLGSQSLNYESDLDLIFVFSNRGNTIGEKQITNSEFFAKVAQRFINALQLLTSAGRCYEIDTELRPSGHMGALVTSYDHFIDHQMNQAQHWERQALIRSRCLTENLEYQNKFESQLQKLVYARPLPNDFTKYMAQIRDQVIKEKVHESENKIDLKLGLGGIMDIEFIIHHIQLKDGAIFPDLQQKSIFKTLRALKNHTIIKQEQLNYLINTYALYRTIESKIHLFKKRSEHLIDFKNDTGDNISNLLNYQNSDILKRELLNHKTKIRELFCEIYKV
ncbi:hypothetical protein BVY03_01470 [bacterium K02(2017)]|nr:hypothetical protein BVY03_01470 [bacterium K02(2017)]